MTPEQEAIRDLNALRNYIARIVAAYETTPGGVDYRAATDALIDAGLRVVGDDEVVVPRSSIREGWRMRNGVVLNTGSTLLGDTRVGVISPWTPEGARMTRTEKLRLIEDAIHPFPRTFAEDGRVANQAIRVLEALEAAGVIEKEKT